MSKQASKVPEWLRPWIEAKTRHRLSQMHIQMARELGMNPRKFGKLDNHRQQPWKAPLPVFIEDLYFKRFGKERPDQVRSFLEIAAAEVARRQARKQRKEERRAARAANLVDGSLADPLPPVPSRPSAEPAPLAR